MSNLEITNNVTRGVTIWDPVFEDNLINFAGVATLKAGTILARRTVEVAVVAVAGANTGDGTVTLATVVSGPVVPLVGAYVLTATTAVTNGGIFQLVDPNGAIVASDLIMTAGAGAATVFEAAGLEFTVTDAGTDFIVGDSFTLTVAADGKLVPYAIAGAGGVQLPLAVLLNELTSTGAGDLPDRPIIAGRVRRGDLVIDADGDASNLTDAIVDQLRDVGIIALATLQLAELDNQ